MHIVLVYRYYNDGIVYYNLTFCTRKSLMTDLGLMFIVCIVLKIYCFAFPSESLDLKMYQLCANLKVSLLRLWVPHAHSMHRHRVRTYLQVVAHLQLSMHNA